MHQNTFLNNLKYVILLLNESGLPLSSDVYASLTSLYTDYKVNEAIKIRAVERGVERFKEVVELKVKIEELTLELANLTQIK